VNLMSVQGSVFGAIVVRLGPIAYVPSFVLGGLLMYIGISFLAEWV